MRIGLDIGGTKIAAVLVDADGHIRSRAWHEHAARGLTDVADALTVAARAVGDGVGIAAAGVSVSGLVGRDGLVTGSAGLDLSGDLTRELAPRLSCPVRVVNDGDATLHAIVRSAGTTLDDLDDVLLIAIGTGVGGAILSDGRAVRGATGLAGEIGHLPVGPETGVACVCGSGGCWEQYAGGRGIAERARRAAAADPAGARLRHVHENSAAGITAAHVMELARENDPCALMLVDDAAAATARAIRSLCVSVEPRTVFLGGTIAHAAADLLLPRIRDHLARHWPFRSLTEPPPLRLDAVGPYAAAIGAADLAGTPTPPPLVSKGPSHE